MRTPPLSVNQRRAILERDNYTCQECGHVGELGVQRGCVQVHHIQARYNGGTNDSKNLVTLCYDCHKKADVQLGRPTTYGQTMLKRTVLMPPAMWGWVEATGAGNVSVGIRQAVDAVSLLSPEQWAWLTRRDDAPAALEDAVRQAMTAVPPSLSSMTVEQLHELREAISKELRETYRASATRTQDGKRKQQEATR